MRPDNVFAAYEKVTGHAPTAGQLRRLDRIRSTLKLRDDDALWSIILTLEHYFRIFTAVPRHYEKAGLAQAEALRERILAESNPRNTLREPIMLRVFAASAVIAIIVSSIIGIITIASFEKADEQAAFQSAHEYVALADEKLHHNFNAAVEKRASEKIQSLMRVKKLMDDPEANALIHSIMKLKPQEREQLLRDPAEFESMLGKLATLTPAERSFLLKVTKSPPNSMQVLKWITGLLVAGDPSLSRMLAAYGARNKQLNQFIAALPASCSLAHYGACQ